jgi:hypothetical protein
MNANLESTVLRPVDGGGGAHGAEAIEQTNDEEDQTLVWFADAIAFEGSVFQTASQVELVGWEAAFSAASRSHWREKVGLTSKTA